MRWALRKIWGDQRGASLVEFSLILPMLFAVIFGIIDMGYLAYQYNAAVKATQAGAQYAATHDPVVSGLFDCGTTDYTDKAGTDCGAVTGYATWTVTCPGGQNCEAGIMADIVTEMQAFYPNLEAANVRVTFSGEPGLGYIGRGRPVPAITVEIVDLKYNFIAVGIFVNAMADALRIDADIGITSARTTVIAEDLREGVGS